MDNERNLEFSLLYSRLTGMGGEVESPDKNWKFSLGSNGEFSGEMYFSPVDISKFTTVEIVMEEGSDRFSGRFRPFFVIQEEVGKTDLDSCKGEEEELCLLYFLLLNTEYVKKLDKKTSIQLLVTLKNGLVRI